jgi:hypothetical protein
MSKLYSFVLLIALSFIPCLVNAQIIEEEFGKNRVQYHDDFNNWWMYESENFITYWYGKARKVAEVSMQLAEIDYEEIVGTIEHRVNEKVEIIVYVDLTDLKQSNLGSEEVFTTSAGETKIVGNKVFVHFNGNHQHLRHQIRTGVSGVLIDALLYGSNLQEIVQNAVLLSLPPWFRDGLISYIGSEWNSDINQELRDVLLDARKKDDFTLLATQHPRVIGHSFWYYLSETYGHTTIANLLYLTRINKDLENGFLFVLGVNQPRLEEEWWAFFQDLTTAPSDGTINSKSFKIKDERRLTKVKFSPSGNQLVFATNELGKSRVYLQGKDDPLLIHKEGYCNNVQDPDYNYPILEWSPNGRKLFIIYEKRDVLYLLTHDVRTEEQTTQSIPTEIQRIYDVAAISERELILAASNNGYSDLFKYFIRTRQFEKLTDDYHDDIEVEYFSSDNVSGVLFLSNRPSTRLLPREYIDTLLPLGEQDIFFYTLNAPTQPISRISNNSFSSKKSLLSLPGGKLAFLSDKSGRWCRRIINVENSISEQQLGLSPEFGYDGLLESTYNDNIELHAFNSSSGLLIDVLHAEDYLRSVERNINSRLIRDTILIENTDSVVNTTPVVDSIDIKYNLDYINFFKTKFENPPLSKKHSPQVTPPIDWNNDKIANYKYNLTSHGKVPKFTHSRAIASRLRFRLDHFNTSLDNSLLFGGLDTYAGTKQGYENPPLGILLKANMKDIFEDYEIEAGSRITTSFNGSEHFILLKDKKRRIDRHYALYRKSIKTIVEEGPFTNRKSRNSTFIALFQARYPLDIYQSFRGSLTFRNDKFNILAIDKATLDAPTLDEQRLGLKLEYVFDNTLDIDVNLKSGTRSKAFVEVVKRFKFDFDPFTFEPNDGIMTVLGVDLRYYKRLLKHSIFAVRLNGATSIGSEKILFFAGGINNWLFPEFDNSTPFPIDDNYAYQTIATNLRGFKYNVRNGGTYFLLNNEFRLPVVKYFTARKIKFTPLQHLQLSAFFDVGLAWFGSSPFGENNPANTITLRNPAVTLNVTSFQDPLIMGYGWGVRTLLFGYYLKFDYAWGIESRKIQDPVFYLSMGFDF